MPALFWITIGSWFWTVMLTFIHVPARAVVHAASGSHGDVVEGLLAAKMVLPAGVVLAPTCLTQARSAAAVSWQIGPVNEFI